MTDVMIDLETMSTRVDARVLQIAAMQFNLESIKIPPLSMFNRYITRQSCEEMGCHTDPKTVQWWKERNPEANACMKKGMETAIPYQQALKELSAWFPKDACIWSHGAGFDIPIIETAMKRLGIWVPWKYINVRDTRTLFALAGKTLEELAPANDKEVAHDAMGDVIRQARAVSLAYAMLQEGAR